jgi:hypothetical protein
MTNNEEQLLKEVQDLKRELSEVRGELVVIKESTDKFDKLHSFGKAVLVVLTSLGAIVLFGLEVARNFKQIFILSHPPILKP